MESLHNLSLTAYGSAFLARPASGIPELFPTSSVFRFTHSIEFWRHARRFGVFRADECVGDRCAPWYADLRTRGALTIRLGRSAATPRNRVLAPHVEAGFSGGLDTVMAVRFADRHCALWSGRWAVTARKHPEQRIWSVKVHGVRTHASPYEGPDLFAATGRLDAALEAVLSLVAGRRYFESWERTFRNARACLFSSAREIEYHPDLLPSEDYDLQARRLLAAASQAWVFGGMGSWNDVALEDDGRYKPFTIELFEAVLDAVLAAANSRMKPA